MIQIIHRDKISEARWNALLDTYQHSSPYAELFYLDAVCNRWSALVFDDYRAVLPFCWNKKWGVRYIYQPAFLQQMMYVGPQTDAETNDKIRMILYAFADFIDLKVNLPISEHQRQNYELLLDADYETLSKNYSTQTKRNLKNKSIEIQVSEDLDDFIVFYHLHTIPKIEDWKTDFSAIQKQLLLQLKANHHLLILKAVAQGEVVSQLAIVKTDRRFILLMNTTSEEGRKHQGISVMIDHLIRTYAGSGMILDFEGSQIEKIAYFNKGFGAENHPYCHLKSNRLKFPFNLFKR